MARPLERLLSLPTMMLWTLSMTSKSSTTWLRRYARSASKQAILACQHLASLSTLMTKDFLLTLHLTNGLTLTSSLRRFVKCPSYIVINLMPP